MGGDSPVGEVLFWIPQPGGPAGGRHGPRTTIEHYMGISTHWGNTVKGGTRRDQGEYCQPPENGHTTHCVLYYHVIVYGGV